MSIQTGIIFGAVCGRGPRDVIKGDFVPVPVHVPRASVEELQRGVSLCDIVPLRRSIPPPVPSL